MHVVPTHAHLQVEVAQVEVDRQELSLQLVIADVVVEVALGVYIHVVAAEGVAQGGTGETAWMDGNFAACHQALAQTERDVGVDGDGRLQRYVEAYLHSGILLGVVAHAAMQLHRLAFARREDEAYPVGCVPRLYDIVPDARHLPECRFEQFLGHDTALGSLVEQVNTHGRGDFLLQPGINAVADVDVELLTQEPFVLWCHVLERLADDAMLLGHYLRTNGMQDYGLERVVDADALLQGDDVVPVAHGQLLAPSDERVDGGLRETGRAVALGVYLQMQVGDGEVLFHLVLTVHVDNLAQYAHGASQVLGLFGCALHGDADDDVGTHLAGDVSRIVVL